MALIVKICGITQPEQGRAIAELGATMLGFICAPNSPRYVTPEQIAQIVDTLPVDPTTGQICCDRVGVFVNADLETIRATVAIGKLNIVQLHGSETLEYCAQLREQLPIVKLIKALRVQSIADALKKANHYQQSVEMLLLDAYHPNLAGGTGQTLDWPSLSSFKPAVPWLLAGGLTPDNVMQALNQVNPAGIDLSSGVEQSPGNKNLSKISQLFTTLHPLRN